jgi:hypothetical protein
MLSAMRRALLLSETQMLWLQEALNLAFIRLLLPALQDLVHSPPLTMMIPRPPPDHSIAIDVAL